jgi:hypothetical protein
MTPDLYSLPLRIPDPAFSKIQLGKHVFLAFVPPASGEIAAFPFFPPVRNPGAAGNRNDRAVLLCRWGDDRVIMVGSQGLQQPS